MPMTDEPTEAARGADAGDGPMTGAQASYLQTLCEEVGVEFDPSLTRAAASELIDALEARNPRLSGSADNPDMS
jgi:hypothetical protein